MMLDINPWYAQESSNHVRCNIVLDVKQKIVHFCKLILQWQIDIKIKICTYCVLHPKCPFQLPFLNNYQDSKLSKEKFIEQWQCTLSVWCMTKNNTVQTHTHAHKHTRKRNSAFLSLTI